ncbi:MAG: DUF3795 domain-containing protein [Armatimonadota bacterium]
MPAKQVLPKDRNLISYCGLDCSQCVIHTTDISGKAKALRRELRSAKAKKFWGDIPFLGEYGPFKKSLDGLAMLRCVKLCRGGGSNPWCKIRKCCQRKKIWSCAECEEMLTCTKLEPITKGYKGKNLKILKVLRKK